MKRFNLRWKDDGKYCSVLYCGTMELGAVEKESGVKYWDYYIYIGQNDGEYSVSTSKDKVKSKVLKLVKEELAKLELVD